MWKQQKKIGRDSERISPLKSCFLPQGHQARGCTPAPDVLFTPAVAQRSSGLAALGQSQVKVNADLCAEHS